MKGLTQAALAGALTMAAGFTPAAVTTAQETQPLVRALQIARGARIGVSVQDLEQAEAKDSKRPAEGVLVETVEPGGPADKGGIKAGDVVTDFDGEKVRSVRQFSRLVQETPPGRAVAVGLARGAQHMNVTVTAERAGWDDDFSMRLLESPRIARPATPPLPPAPPAAARPPAAPAPPFEIFRYTSGRRLGISIESLDDQLAQYFGVKDGVLVRSVEADSAAHKAGLKAGDVITSINGRAIYEASDVNRAIDRMDADGEFSVEIVRDHKPQTLKGKLEARRGRTSTMMF